MKNKHKIQANDYFIIPNPIYDVVFKYLMEDNESAKIVLSTLINENIKKLTFEPISHTEKIKDPKTAKEIKLFHLDFTALIEKTDVEKINKPIRLIPIFILNFRIENEINDLIIKTNRIKTGIFKNKQLQNDNEFIDNLSFDIWVVQLPNLNKIQKSDYENDEYKTKLYSLLKLFDQEAQNKTNKHRLLLIKKIFPGFLERIINRLKSADADNPDLEEQMNAEDEYLAELIKRDNEISYFKQQLDYEKKINKEKDKALGEKDKALGEKDKEDKALGEKDKALGEKDKVLGEKDKALGEKDKMIIELVKTLKENNIPIEIIINKTKLSKRK